VDTFWTDFGTSRPAICILERAGRHGASSVPSVRSAEELAAAIDEFKGFSWS